MKCMLKKHEACSTGTDLGSGTCEHEVRVTLQAEAAAKKKARP